MKYASYIELSTKVRTVQTISDVKKPTQLFWKVDFKALWKREVAIIFDDFNFLKANSMLEGDVHLTKKLH